MKKRIIVAAQSAMSDSFLRNNVILFFGSFAVAVLNYLYHPILSRIMTVEDFGEVQTILSLVAQIGIVSMVFGLIVVNIISHAKNDPDAEKTVAALHSIAFCLTLVIALAITFTAPFLQKILQFSTISPFYVLSVILLLSIYFAFQRGYLQGLGNFGSLSIVGVIQSLGKLIFAILLVLLGFRTFGAVLALALASTVGIIYMYTQSRTHLPFFSAFRINSRIWKELSYGALILLAVGSITVLYTIDVVIIKYLFTPEEAGFYSGIATIARSIFFLTASIAAVVLPSVKRSNLPQENRTIFKKALLLMVILGGGACAVFFFFPELVIRMLIGERYLVFAALLPLLSLTLFLVSLLNLFYSYFLALRKFILVPLTIGGTILFSFLVFQLHSTIQEIVTDLLITSGVMLICTTCYFWYDMQKSTLAVAQRT